MHERGRSLRIIAKQQVFWERGAGKTCKKMRIFYCTYFLLSFTFLYDKNSEIDRLKFAKSKPQATAENFFWG